MDARRFINAVEIQAETADDYHAACCYRAVDKFFAIA